MKPEIELIRLKKNTDHKPHKCKFDYANLFPAPCLQHLSKVFLFAQYTDDNLEKKINFAISKRPKLIELRLFSHLAELDDR